MKFPRNARIFRGQLDAAPFASVFFLLLMFVLLGSLVYTPGARVDLRLPVSDELPGTDRPSVVVAVDVAGGLYFRNQMITAADLQPRLEAAVEEAAPEPLALVVYMDKETSYDHLIALAGLAKKAGIRELCLATLPRLFPDKPGVAGRP